MSSNTAHHVNEPRLSRQQAKAEGAAIRELSDDSYEARCKLKFSMAVIRELSLCGADEPLFSSHELNGFALVMKEALEELDSLLDKKGPQ